MPSAQATPAEQARTAKHEHHTPPRPTHATSALGTSFYGALIGTGSKRAGLTIGYLIGAAS